eukprot:gene6197-1107_t
MTPSSSHSPCPPGLHSPYPYNPVIPSPNLSTTLSTSWSAEYLTPAALPERLSTRVVLYTQIGYSSVDYCGRKGNFGTSPNQQCQTNAYTGMLQALWNHPLISAPLAKSGLG